MVLTHWKDAACKIDVCQNCQSTIIVVSLLGHPGIHLLFAGSMFEHSCLPNCFLGTWDSDSIDTLQTYRALRDIAEGEALTIDYMGFPQGYCAVSARAQAFQKWGFICSCPRCVELPEVERSYFAYLAVGFRFYYYVFCFNLL